MGHTPASSRGTYTTAFAALLGAVLPPAGWLLSGEKQGTPAEAVASISSEPEIAAPTTNIPLRESGEALRQRFREMNEAMKQRGDERRSDRFAAIAASMASRQSASQRLLAIDRELRDQRDATQLHRARDLARDAIVSAHAKPSAAAQAAERFHGEFYARAHANIDSVQRHQAAEIARVESEYQTRLTVARVGVVVVTAVATAGIASAISAPATAGASVTTAGAAEGAAAVSGAAAAESAVVAAEGSTAVAAVGESAVTAGTVAEAVGTNVAVSSGMEAGSTVLAADSGVVAGRSLASTAPLAEAGLPSLDISAWSVPPETGVLSYPQCTATEPIGFCQVSPIGPQLLTQPLPCNLYTTYTNGVAGTYAGTVHDAQLLSNHLGRPVLVNYDPPTGNALDGLFKLGQGKVAPFADFQSSAATNRLGNFYGEVLAQDGNNAVQSIVHSRGTITNANAQLAAMSGRSGIPVTEYDLLTRSSTTAFGPGHTQFRFPTTTVQFSGDPIPSVSSFVEEQFGLRMLRGEFSPAMQSFTLPSDGLAHSAATYFSRLPEVPTAITLPPNCLLPSTLPRVGR